MISVQANISSNVVLVGANSYSYYLFVFTLPGVCTTWSEVFAADTTCSDPVVTILSDLGMGVYNVDIYGQNDYANTNIIQANYITSDKFRVYNPAGICWNSTYILDEFNYPILDEMGNYIKYK